ncbi:hypothetical protein DY000_02032552 [Brassica cretica]|uniref:Uncharacterized protein n=1 Tax=Brassica cretica TaxID=69181 RepID=A0ABQ7DBQ9_BRACR|nr:hypothetical protein DY000_02032552 [Brassica cretica]
MSFDTLSGLSLLILSAMPGFKTLLHCPNLILHQTQPHHEFIQFFISFSNTHNSGHSFNMLVWGEPNYLWCSNQRQPIPPFLLMRNRRQDEAIIDEISMVDKKISQLQADFQSFKRTTTLRLQEHGKKIDESLLEMKRIFHDQTILLDELRNKSTLVLDAKSQSLLLNIAAATIALGTMAWLYAKITVG